MINLHNWNLCIYRFQYQIISKVINCLPCILFEKSHQIINGLRIRVSDDSPYKEVHITIYPFIIQLASYIRKQFTTSLNICQNICFHPRPWVTVILPHTMLEYHYHISLNVTTLSTLSQEWCNAVCRIKYCQQYPWKSMDYNLNIQKYEINYKLATV